MLKRITLKKYSAFRFVAWINIFFQLLFPLSISFSPAVIAASANYPILSQVDENENNEDEAERKLASGAISAGNLISGDAKASNMAREIISSQASNEVQQWMNQFGNSRVTLSLDDKAQLKNSQFDLLLPLAERESDLLFSQTSLHRTDDRSHLNLGIGTRHFTTEFMLGGNLFYDRDMTRSHSRAGVGLEYWRDELKLAANGYHRLSGWQTSPDFIDYRERPASGWDVRAEAFLPVYPQLGGKLVYEKYYGDEVALFGKDKLQRNPHAITSGISYTPFPLISFDAEHRQGKGSANDSRIGLNVNWQIGKSISHHLSGDAVASMRSLKGSRYDFVDRNNTIVLEYQKETVITFVTPDSVRGVAGTAVSFATQVDARHGLDRIEWTAPSLTYAGGKVTSMGSSHTIQLPELMRTTRDASANTYLLQGVAIDRNGNRSQIQETLVHVDAPTIHADKSQFEPAHSILPTDGQSKQELILSILDVDGNLVNVPASEISIDVASDRGTPSGKVSSVKAVGTGKFSITVTAGTDVEKITLIPDVQGVKLSTAEVVTENMAENATLLVTPNRIVADRAEAASLALTLKNSADEAISGQNVTFKVEGVENTVLSSISEKNGVYIAQLSGGTAGVVSITPLIDGNPVSHLSDTVTLTANGATAQFAGEMTVIDNHAVADGVSVNRVQVKVTDAMGNLLADHPVSFSAASASTESSVKTGKDGIATSVITSEKAGEHDIIAQVEGEGRDISGNVVFISGAVEAEKSSFGASPKEIAADGQSVSKLTFTAKDVNNNSVNGLRVTFDHNGSPETIIGNVTETNGVYVAELRGKTAGTVNVTPLVDGKPLGNLSDTVTLFANPETAQLSGDMTVINNHAVADGAAVNRVQVKVTDESGNALKDIAVRFYSDNTNASVQSPVETDINGIAIAAVTSRVSGDLEVSAEVGSSNRSKTVSFISGAVSEEKSTFKALPAKITANGEEASELTFTAKDANNNPVSGLSVTFNSNGNSNVAIDAVTENNGVYVSKLRGKVAETVTIIPSVDGKSLSSLSDKVELIADIQTARITEITVDSDNARASGTDKNIVTVTVKDEFNNIVSGASVKFSVASGASIFPRQNTTDQQGKISAEITSQNEGTYAVMAEINGRSETEKKVQTTFVSDAVLSDFTVISDSARADGVANNEVSATVTDSNGNALVNQVVIFTVTNGAILKAPTAKTNAEGVAVVTLTSENIGEAIVTASTNGSSKTVPVAFSTYVTSLTVTASKTDVSVGDKIQLTVVAKDKNGKPVPNATVAFSRDEAKTRKGVSTMSSSVMLFGGVSGINSVVTGKDGIATIAVEDPKGLGVESTIKAHFGSSSAGDLVNSNEVKLIYRVKTSPDSSYANMWGNMTETVGDARRPLLYGENGLTSDYSQNVNNESWAVFKSPTSAKNACGGNKSKMATKASLLSVNLGNAGWPQWSTYDNPQNPSELMSNAMYILPEGLASYYTPAVAKNNSLMTLSSVFSPYTTPVAGTGFLATCKV